MSIFPPIYPPQLNKIVLALNNFVREKSSSVDWCSIERCGYAYLVGNELQIVESVNLAQEPVNSFIMHPSDSIKVLDKIANKAEVVVWHTHVLPSATTGLSPVDIQSAESLGLPMYVCHLPTGIFDYYDPNLKLPYEGRIYKWTSSNCYTLIRDWYKYELGIKLNNYFLPREGSYNESNFDLFLNNIEREGFKEISIENIQVGDLILFKLGRVLHSNHIGIYLGDNKFLHHLTNRLSSVDDLGIEWRRRAVSTHHFCL